MREVRFGIDIGGTGIKGAAVDVTAGTLTTQRLTIPTPQPATPRSVIPLALDLVRRAGFEGPVGCAFPAVIKSGAAQTAANVDHSWIGHSVENDLTAGLGGAAVTVVNDADAAGVAEMAFGAGCDVAGVVVMLTVGTGIGSAVFLDGVLVPNTELGHLEVDGKDGEKRAAASVRDAEDLSWTTWAARFSTYVRTLEALLWPDLIIVGGGISKSPQLWLGLVDARTRIVPATLANDAGIVGAALVARSEPAHPARLDAAHPDRRTSR